MSMKEKYESLPLIQLREIAKVRGLRRISTLKKADLIQVMLKEDEKDKEKEAQSQENKRYTENQQGSSQTDEQRTENRPSLAHPQEHSEQEEQRTESRPSMAHPREHSEQEEQRSGNTRSTERQQPEQQPEQGRAYGQNTQQRHPGRTMPRPELDSGDMAEGILEVMQEGFGFIRCENFLPGENDVYVAPSQIRRFQLRTGDIICGNKRIKTATEKFSALLYVKTVNGRSPMDAARRPKFEEATPIFPDECLRLSRGTRSMAMRIVDLISPVGKGQRGMIVSPPKAGKTTLLKEVARSITRNYPDMYLIILLIDERPEEVTDIKESIEGEHVEVIYSTFDELPDRHKRVSEMVLERAKRLAEEKRDVVILLDSITRLARAYNLTVPPSGRTLSGGLDPAALHMPKRFFGAARNLREGGSLTILATALVDTGSKMDDVVYEEFKGTGNMELVLDRKLSERRVFPAVDIVKSGTRREDLLLTREEQEAVYIMRRSLNGAKPDEAVERILDMFVKTRDNDEFVFRLRRQKFI